VGYAVQPPQEEEQGRKHHRRGDRKRGEVKLMMGQDFEGDD